MSYTVVDMFQESSREERVEAFKTLRNAFCDECGGEIDRTDAEGCTCAEGVEGEAS